jgi:hypothetical protein
MSSLLELYTRGSMTGVAGPSAVRQTRQATEAPSNLRPQNPGAFGDTYADATLEAARSGRNALATRATLVSQPPMGRYTADIFEQSNTSTNTLVNRATGAGTYGPGRFNSDPLTYTDRQFAIANASMGQAAVTPSVLQAARASALVTTPVDSNIGTVASEPIDDGRYIATVGYDFVLYTTRGTYG